MFLLPHPTCSASRLTGSLPPAAYCKPSPPSRPFREIQRVEYSSPSGVDAGACAGVEAPACCLSQIPVPSQRPLKVTVASPPARAGSKPTFLARPDSGRYVFAPPLSLGGKSGHNAATKPVDSPPLKFGVVTEPSKPSDIVFPPEPRHLALRVLTRRRLSLANRLLYTQVSS